MSKTDRYLSAQIISKNIFIAELYKTYLQEGNYNGKVTVSGGTDAPTLKNFIDLENRQFFSIASNLTKIT